MTEVKLNIEEWESYTPVPTMSELYMNNVHGDKVLDITSSHGLAIGDTIYVFEDETGYDSKRVIKYFYDRDGVVKARTECGNYAGAEYYSQFIGRFIPNGS